MLGIPSIVLVILGAILNRHAAFKFTELILGLFLILFSLFLLFRPSAKLAPNWANATTCGGIAGFLAGLIETGGAIRGLVLAGVDFSRMIVYLRSGFLTQESYWLVPSLLLIAFTGSYVGKVLLNKIPQERFRKIVLLLVLVIGLTTLGRFIHHLMR